MEGMAQAPVVERPSTKERRYDRQLRLWAASGQAALESANVLLVNSGSGAVGVEALKNLVLPGIGKFTIADPAVVNDADLGVNFFLDESCRGKSRAQCCTELLLDLNSDVSGSWYPEHPTQDQLYLRDLFASSDVYTVILYVLPLPEVQVSLIKAYARQHRVPLVAVHSVGYYSYFNITLPGVFPLVETHPDETAAIDLRLLSPWAELSAYTAKLTRDIEKLEDFDHGHLPFVVILLHFLDVWKISHEGKYPTSYADKIAFRGLIARSMRKDNAECGEENFEEAMAAVMKHVALPSIRSPVLEMLQYSGPRKPRKFWLLVEALNQFQLKHQQLPVPGTLPDMKAQPATYVKLQKIYKAKARQDAEEVLRIARAMDGGDQIDLEEVELFCTNARFVKLINSDDRREIEEVIVEEELGKDGTAGIDTGASRSLLPIYLALVVISHFPAAGEDEIMASIIKRAPRLKGNEKTIQIARELSRAGGGELHNVSAATGGMVAQEIIKILTAQYIPIDNTCIFDGIEDRCQVLRL